MGLFDIFMPRAQDVNDLVEKEAGQYRGADGSFLGPMTNDAMKRYGIPDDPDLREQLDIANGLAQMRLDRTRGLYDRETKPSDIIGGVLELGGKAVSDIQGGPSLRTPFMDQYMGMGQRLDESDIGNQAATIEAATTGNVDAVNKYLENKRALRLEAIQKIRQIEALGYQAPAHLYKQAGLQPKVNPVAGDGPSSAPPGMTGSASSGLGSGGATPPAPSPAAPPAPQAPQLSPAIGAAGISGPIQTNPNTTAPAAPAAPSRAPMAPTGPAAEARSIDPPPRPSMLPPSAVNDPSLGAPPNAPSPRPDETARQPLPVASAYKYNTENDAEMAMINRDYEMAYHAFQRGEGTKEALKAAQDRRDAALKERETRAKSRETNPQISGEIKRAQEFAKTLEQFNRERPEDALAVRKKQMELDRAEQQIRRLLQVDPETGRVKVSRGLDRNMGGADENFVTSFYHDWAYNWPGGEAKRDWSTLQNLENKLQSMGRRMMVEATGSGGGNTTEAEWPKFSAALANIQPDQGEELMAENLMELLKSFRRMRQSAFQFFDDKHGTNLSGAYEADLADQRSAATARLSTDNKDQDIDPATATLPTRGKAEIPESAHRRAARGAERRDKNEGPSYADIVDAQMLPPEVTEYEDAPAGPPMSGEYDGKKYKILKVH